MQHDLDGAQAEALNTSYIARVTEALGASFRVLNSAGGALPNALVDAASDAPAYLAGVSRDCTRELYALVSDWRVPSGDEWSAWPPDDDASKNELPNCLIALADVSSRDGFKIRLVVKAAGGGLYALQPALELSSALGGSARACRVAAGLHIRMGSFCLVSYVGDLVSALVAARELRTANSPLVDVLRPHAPNPLARWEAPRAWDAPRIFALNTLQLAALCGLRHRVELIVGPPGTGKSTTILSLVQECLLPGEAAIVTAVQNRAIEALTDKFARARLPFVVVGSRLTGDVADWTLEEQIERHGGVAAAKLWIRRLALTKELLRAGLRVKARQCFAEMETERRREYRADLSSRIAARVLAFARGRESGGGTLGFEKTEIYRTWAEEQGGGRHLCDEFVLPRLKRLTAEYVASAPLRFWRRAATALTRARYAAAYSMLAHVEQTAIYDAPRALNTMRCTASDSIVLGARALLCTTASVGPAIPDADLHAALPPFSRVRDDAGSLMLRLERSGHASSRMLVEQYRMPGALADVVSACFYRGLLRTSQSKLDSSPRTPGTLGLIEVPGQAETHGEYGTSAFNVLEAEAVVHKARELRVAYPADTIAVLTTYRAQEKLVRTLLDEARIDAVEALSIDAAQGRGGFISPTPP
ncbi:hypothetical protein KFE25_003825 [Diacronema lutheri]|uniref:DNA2/NAM7 helicase-like C-terminal domain-containing protein n=1 Tax=Diacronema lutheri TaxID=2081491 RepID=A0A8J6C6H3_DIALT|nr:hypothetical protein KFE25_003825 [Diacronema lutheri]